jgi:hypothetical protein
MAEYRTQQSRILGLGSEPPQLLWTVVRGDTSSFRVYVTDDNKEPLDISSWILAADFYRPSTSTTIVQTVPEVTEDDVLGSFTVSLGASQSEVLQTDDIFDIQISNDQTVWTVGMGKVLVIEDVTN